MVVRETKSRLKLYEALELRSEYDARMKTLKDCLPESRENRGWLRSLRDDEHRRPSPDFDLATTRDDLRRLEVKRRKLNTAIQQANSTCGVRLACVVWPRLPRGGAVAVRAGFDDLVRPGGLRRRGARSACVVPMIDRNEWNDSGARQGSKSESAGDGG